MLDLIKYSSLRLRNQEGRCSPQGPAFESARNTKVRFPQCTLEIKLPSHSPKRGDGTEQTRILKDIYRLEGRSYNRNIMPSKSWGHEIIASRSWVFNGPWFTGYKGQVSFSMSGINPGIQNPKLNFLHPKGFEAGVLGFLTASWGHRVYDEEQEIPEYKAPLNWSPLTHLKIPAAQFDMEVAAPVSRYRFVFFPASRDRLIHIRFSYWQACAGSQQEQDQQIDPKPMQDLIDNIIRSIQLTLSPEMETELAEIRKSCPDLNVSTECAPLKWPADVDKDGFTILEYNKRRYTTPDY